MAIARVQSATPTQSSTSGSTLTITLGSSVTVGNHIIVCCGFSGSTGLTVAITDAAGNTYTTDVTTDDGNATGAYSAIASARCTTSLTAGQTITMTTSGSVTHRLLCAYEYSGLNSSSWADGSSNTGKGTSTAPLSGSITTTGTDLLIGACGYNSGTASHTTTSPWTSLNEVNSSGKGLEVDERLNLTAGTYSHPGTLSSSMLWSDSIAAYAGPSVVPANFSGTSGGTGTTSGGLAPRLSGTTAGVSTSTGILTPQLRGTVAGVSTVTGILTPRLGGSTAGSGTTTGAIVAGVPFITGTSAGSGTSSGVLAPKFVGTSAGTGAATANFAPKFTGTSAGVGATVGSPIAVPPTADLSGSTSGAGTTTGTITNAAGISGATAGFGSVTGRFQSGWPPPFVSVSSVPLTYVSVTGVTGTPVALALSANATTAIVGNPITVGLTSSASVSVTVSTMPLYAYV